MSSIDQGATDVSVVDKTNSAAITVLVCSGSRGVLRQTLISWLYCIKELSSRAMKMPEAFRRPVNQLMELHSSQPFDSQRVAQLVAELEYYQKEAYDSAGFTPEQREATERKMMATSKIPEVLLPLAERLLTSSIGKLVADDDHGKSALDQVRLYMPRALMQKQVDNRRKTPIRLGKQNGCEEWLECSRCQAVASQQSTPPRWFQSLPRTCTCSNAWVITRRLRSNERDQVVDDI